MFIRIQPKTLFQVFCKIIFHFQVILKSIKDPDDNFKSNGLTHSYLEIFLTSAVWIYDTFDNIRK